jgi:mannose/cellobiose epimerase-like protein (N-acyl-D-glucosamine 2-epimerase family)
MDEVDPESEWHQELHQAASGVVHELAERAKQQMPEFVERNDRRIEKRRRACFPGRRH